MGGIGGMKLVGNETGIERAIRLGYNNILIPIGIAEVLAGAGVLIGAAVTDLEWLGTVAPIGIILRSSATSATPITASTPAPRTAATR